MGLIVDIYRADYRSRLCAFKDVRAITIVNVDGPFDPTPDRPAAMLVRGPLGNPVVIPVDDDGVLPASFRGASAFGGSYAATSDSRFHDAVRFYGAVPIHDYAVLDDGQTD